MPEYFYRVDNADNMPVGYVVAESNGAARNAVNDKMRNSGLTIGGQLKATAISVVSPDDPVWLVKKAPSYELGKYVETSERARAGDVEAISELKDFQRWQELKALEAKNATCTT